MAFPKRHHDALQGRPALKILRPDDDVPSTRQANKPKRRRPRPQPKPVETPPATSGGGGLTIDSRVSDAFTLFYVPHRLKLTQEEAKDHSNAVSKRESVAWWVRLMDDPPLKLITDASFDLFERRLRAATWRRGLAGRLRPLDERTIFKHVKQVAEVVRACGPKAIDRRKAFAGVLVEVPIVSMAEPETDLAREPFIDDEPRRVFDACRFLTAYGIGRGGSRDGERRGNGGEGADNYWRAAIACFYYCGFRLGTLLKLEWSMIERRGKHWFFKAPGRINKKGRMRLKFIHEHLYELLERLPRTSAQIFDWPHSRTHFRSRHKWLQKLAKLDELRTIHDWKRTHLDLMDEAGADQGLRVAQLAGDHKDSATTLKHYLRHELKYIRKLPPLDPAWKPAPPADPNQSLLF